MGKLNLKLMGAVAATALLLTPIANAQLILQISDTADFSGTTVTAIDADNDGLLSISSALGAFSINGVTGFGSPAIGTDYYDNLHLNSFNISGAAGTLYIRLSDTDFDRGDASYNTLFGGVAAGTVSFQSYVDSSNAHFGTETLLSNSGLLGAGAISGTDGGGISMTGPYSMSIYASVTHSGASQITSFDYDIKVPEPSSLALLGLGLIGAGFASRRKPKKTA